MKKDTNYFPHDYHARKDPKCSALINDFGHEGYGIYWAIIEILHEQNNELKKFPKLFDGLAHELFIEKSKLEKIIEALLHDYVLLHENDEKIWCERIAKNFEEREAKKLSKREAGRIGGLKSGKVRQKTEANEALLRSTNEANEANEANKKKRKEIKENIYIADTSAQDFSFSQKLEAMKTSKDKRMNIIASYWELKSLSFENEETYSSALRREIRPATNLIGYEIEKIVKTMYWLKANADYKWTLETVHKYIDEQGTTTEKLNSDIFF